MKICYIADGQSIHTQRWCKAVAARGHEVSLLTFRPVEIDGVSVYTIWRPFQSRISREASLLSRIMYLFGIFQVRKLVRDISPDILHGFYATSYGLMTALAGQRPYMISVWGSDINVSPGNWVLHKIVTYVLKHADQIFCTSQALLEAAKKFAPGNKDLTHIPFGIDLLVFKSNDINHEKQPGTVIIGTTKSHEKIYGLDHLIQAFAQCYKIKRNIQLHLVGSGSREHELRDLVEELGIQEVTMFIKVKSHAGIPEVLERMDIFAIPSLQESFGVAALEASAMRLPVVGSKVGGIPEVVLDGKTGLLVSPADVAGLRDAMMTLIEDQNFRNQLGESGRAFVESEYDWSENVSSLLGVYEKCTDGDLKRMNR